MQLLSRYGLELEMGILDVNVRGDESRVYQHQWGYFCQLMDALGVAFTKTLLWPDALVIA